MAQTGYTPILIYSSSTTTNAPAAGSLTNSTLGSELAINITDGKLFYKDNANNVQVIAWKTTPTTAGGTGLTSYTAGDLLYYATGTTLSKLAIGASKTILTSSGTAPQWSTNLDTTQGGTGLTTYTAGDLPYYATGTALSKLGIGAANTVLTSSGSAPQWTVQSSLSVGTAANLLSNATTGVMQIVGPGAGTTRVMTIPNANFTVARTDAAQTFTGTQTINGILDVIYGTGDQLLINAKTNDGTAANNAGIGLRANSSATAGSRFAQLWFDADGGNLSGGDYFLMTKNGNDGTIDLIQYSNSAMRFAANYIGRATIDMTLFPSGGVSIGNTTDPGAGNLYVNTNLGVGTSPSYGLHVSKSVTGDFSARISNPNSTNPNGLLIDTPNKAGAALYGLRIDNSTTTVFSAFTNGNLTITGALSKGSGSFRIDHPLPELEATHQLVHSFVESPQADLIYRGKVNLGNGKAQINIDQAAGMTEGTFVALCREVQCFTSNEQGWNHVRGFVDGNILTIECQNQTATDLISWMVIGERKDKHMMDTDWTDDNGKVIVEPLKQQMNEKEVMR
jgi:hypothetical protein